MNSKFACVLCSGDQISDIVSPIIKGDSSGTLKAVACSCCGHVQMFPQNYEMDFYEEDGQVNNVIKFYGTPLETLLDHSWIEARRRYDRFGTLGIDVTKISDQEPLHVLDVGGGYGFFASEMMRRLPSCRVTVLEPSNNRILSGKGWLSEGNHPVPTFINDLLDEKYVEANRAKFHIVTMWHVLEHVTDPVNLLKNASELLAPGGILCVEVPNANDELTKLSSAFRARTFIVEHISYFSPHTLKIAASKAVNSAEIKIHGYQRYGIFNYFHWVRFNAPEGSSPDLFAGRDRMWIESAWRAARESALTSDALFMTISVK